MEQGFGIFCVLFSAIFVSGLFTEPAESDLLKEAIEHVLQDRFIEETLRELYDTDNEELADASVEERNADNDALMETIRTFINAKRLRQNGIQNIYERWDDLHGRGTDTTTRRPVTEIPSSPETTTTTTIKTTTSTTMTVPCKWRGWLKWLCRRNKYYHFSALRNLIQNMLVKHSD